MYTKPHVSGKVIVQRFSGWKEKDRSSCMHVLLNKSPLCMQSETLQHTGIRRIALSAEQLLVTNFPISHLSAPLSNSLSVQFAELLCPRWKSEELHSVFQRKLLPVLWICYSRLRKWDKFPFSFTFPESLVISVIFLLSVSLSFSVIDPKSLKMVSLNWHQTVYF